MGGFNLREIMDSARTFRSQRSSSSSNNVDKNLNRSPPAAAGGSNNSHQSGGNSSHRHLPSSLSFSSSGSVRGKMGTMSVIHLPPEILAHVFSFLSGKDISNAFLACKVFHQMSRIEKLWQNLSLTEFGIVLPPAHIPSYTRRMYTQVLHKYRHLFGLWQHDITHYGGLVQVKFEDGKIIAYECRVPCDPNYMDPLRRKEIFSIGLSDDGEVEQLCLSGFRGPHKCQINMRSSSNFCSKCCVHANHSHPLSKEEEYREWFQEEVGNVARLLYTQNQDLILIKFLIFKQYECCYEYNRLTLPPARPQSIIQPGLFKGTYGDNGLELVILAYDEDGYTVKAKKITGDQNVPANKVTFRADLRYSLVLTELEQLDMDMLITMRRSSSCILPENLPAQPFRIPQNCMERGVYVPNQCKARFHGFGQIAGHGFTNSSYTPGHWIVFSEDLFGFLWLSLQSLSMYHRVKDPIY